jgi:hypothetical protein
MTSLTSLNSGFVAGTLVHTDQGLVPIERIKVGDLVLSRDESGAGELAYKRVTHNFCTEEQPLIASVIANIIPDVIEDYEFIFSSYIHPFAVKDKVNPANFNWESIGALVQGDEFVGKDEKSVFLGLLEDSVYLESAGNQIDFAFWRSPSFRRGRLLDFNDYLDGTIKYINHSYTDTIWLDENFDENGEVRQLSPFLRSVYNIEVEDFHTYYVGVLGLWVHDNHNYPAQ